jgi:DNA-binding NtrC family response regulator
MEIRQPTLVLVDIDAAYRDRLSDFAGRHRLQVVCVSGHFAFEPSADHPRLCVVGARSNDPDYGDRIRAICRTFRTRPVVVLGHDMDARASGDLMRLGVADVIRVPANPDVVAERTFRHLPGQADQAMEDLVGDSEVMRRVQAAIRSAARSSSTVLLTGETGTGKGVVARTIHRLSDRSDHPFIHVDCASLSPTVIESELFGHEKGAFTGATARRPGRFELAAEGTIFLDEIGDLGPELQSKLLRILQDREYERIGGTKTLCMTARIIAATNQDLAHAVEIGRFRADLFYRLNVLRLTVPPLRERIADVPATVNFGLRRLAARLRVVVPSLSDSFLARLTSHPWPGNVRELMNVLERLLVQGYETLEEGDLDGILDHSFPWGPAAAQPVSFTVPPPAAAPERGRRLERDDIVATLVATGGNVARAARRLGVARSTLRYRIRKCGLAALIPCD